MPTPQRRRGVALPAGKQTGRQPRAPGADRASNPACAARQCRAPPVSRVRLRAADRRADMPCRTSPTGPAHAAPSPTHIPLLWATVRATMAGISRASRLEHPLSPRTTVHPTLPPVAPAAAYAVRDWRKIHPDRPSAAVLARPPGVRSRCGSAVPAPCSGANARRSPGQLPSRGRSGVPPSATLHPPPGQDSQSVPGLHVPGCRPAQSGGEQDRTGDMSQHRSAGPAQNARQPVSAD